MVALKKVPLHHPERMQQILSELRALQANMVSITNTAADKQQARATSPLPPASGAGRSPKHHRTTSSTASVSASASSATGSSATGAAPSSSSPPAPSSSNASEQPQQQQPQQAPARPRNTSLQRTKGAEQGPSQQGHNASKRNLLSGISLPKMGSNNGSATISPASGEAAAGAPAAGYNRSSFGGAGVKFSLDPRTRLPLISINTASSSSTASPPSGAPSQPQPQPQTSQPASPVGSVTASPLGAEGEEASGVGASLASASPAGGEEGVAAEDAPEQFCPYLLSFYDAFADFKVCMYV